MHALLAPVREYICQYAEKVNPGLHATLNRGSGVWDAVQYRIHTANNYGTAVVLARAHRLGPCSFGWLMDSGICDGISMDLCKSTMDIYRRDDFQPTASAEWERQRQRAYHSVYLDLLDDLVGSGAPEVLVHYAQAGFVYVQLQERYIERRIGHRLPLRPPVTAAIRAVLGDPAAEPRPRSAHARVPTPALDRSHHAAAAVHPAASGHRVALRPATAPGGKP